MPIGSSIDKCYLKGTLSIFWVKVKSINFKGKILRLFLASDSYLTAHIKAKQAGLTRSSIRSISTAWAYLMAVNKDVICYTLHY